MMASWEKVTCHENHQNWWWDILPIGVLNSSRSGSETELSDSNNSSSSDSNSDSSSDSDNENKSVGREEDTLQKSEVCAQLNALEKRFKICHIFVIRKHM